MVTNTTLTNSPQGLHSERWNKWRSKNVSFPSWLQWLHHSHDLYELNWKSSTQTSTYLDGLRAARVHITVSESLRVTDFQYISNKHRFFRSFSDTLNQNLHREWGPGICIFKKCHQIIPTRWELLVKTRTSLFIFDPFGPLSIAHN